MAAVFALALFVSATLLFWMQPMVGRMFLPLLGGKPAVWNTCLLFFQAMLLGGYLLAHWISRRFTLKGQVTLQILFLVGAGLLLPIQIRASFLDSLPAGGDPTLWLLRALALAAGLPFLILAANGPLLQHWFSGLKHPAASDPYFLYSASNAGSLAALLAAPTLFDRMAGLESQTWLWAGAYVFLLVLIGSAGCSACAGRAERGGAFPARPPLSHAPAASRSLSDHTVPWAQRLRWSVLAFIPSSLMMAVTSYISSDLATIPLFWVIPLALYLLSFILAFAPRGRKLVPVAARLFPIAAIVITYTLLSEASEPPWLILLIHLLFLFIAALALHGRLAQERPEAAHLTEFFLWVSVGGTCAGLFNVLIAPNIFSSVVEYPIGVVLACFFCPALSFQPAPERGAWLDLLVPATLGIITVALARLSSLLQSPALHLRPALAFALPAVTSYTTVDRRLRFGLTLGAILLASSLYVPAQGRALYRTRNFFGVSRVTLDRSGQFRRLVHGNTLHGMQAIRSTGGCDPLAYYHPSGPLGQIFPAFHRDSKQRPPRVAVVGLGIGSMICYAQPEEQWTFYEIDPAMARLARNTNYFTFLHNAPLPEFQLLLGDARLRLAQAPPAHFGLIVLDAFSSDAIPLHLLSEEAMRLYLSKLAPHGLLAFHISNRYLNLEPVLANLAQRVHLAIRARDDPEEDPQRGKEQSQWAVLARESSDFGPILRDSRWLGVPPAADARAWTDDFQTVFSIFRWN